MRPAERRSREWAAVIVNYNSAVFLDGCLRALFGGVVPPAEVVVVDNASTDDSVSELAGWPRVLLERSPVNLGFAGGANLGIALTEAPLVVVLNPDVDLDPDFGPALLRVFGPAAKLGAAGVKLRYPQRNVLQHAGGVLEYPLLTTHHRGYGEEDRGQWDQAADVDFVTGGAMALRRAAVEAIGGFDESFYPAYYEDVDLCLRLRQGGWRVRYEPVLRGTHFESVTLGKSLSYYRHFHRNRMRFAVKHLSREAWWRDFVPAEVERLRGELMVVKDADWPVLSGAQAVEEAARGVRGSDAGSALHGQPLAAMIQSLDDVRHLAWLRPMPEKADRSLRDRVRGWLNRLSVRAALDDLFWRQRAFNDAIVRTLEAQDRLNREVIADLLLTMLDVAGRTRGRSTPGDPAERAGADSPFAQDGPPDGFPPLGRD